MATAAVNPTPKQPSSAVKCVRDIRDLPPETYRMPSDGRTWRHSCDQRRALANQLATFADSDGTGIEVGIARLMKAMSWSRAHVHRRLDDLRKLGFLSNGKRAAFMGTRQRVLNVAEMQAADVSSTTAVVPSTASADVSSTASADVSSTHSDVSSTHSRCLKYADQMSQVQPPDVRGVDETQPTHTNRPYKPTTHTGVRVASSDSEEQLPDSRKEQEQLLTDLVAASDGEVVFWDHHQRAIFDLLKTYESAEIVGAFRELLESTDAKDMKWANKVFAESGAQLCYAYRKAVEEQHAESAAGFYEGDNFYEAALPTERVRAFASVTANEDVIDFLIRAEAKFVARGAGTTRPDYTKLTLTQIADLERIVEADFSPSTLAHSFDPKDETMGEFIERWLRTFADEMPANGRCEAAAQIPEAAQS